MPFAPFGSVDRTALRWLRIEDEPVRFRLLSGDAEVANLAWGPHGGSLANAATSTERWTLKRGGFLNPHVTVRRAGAGENLARLSVGLSSHRIEVLRGATYRFHRAGLRVPAWKVTTEDGQEILHIEPVREGRKLAGGAAIPSPAGVDLTELLLLVVIGWYFIVLAWFEDEALVPLEGPEAGALPEKAGHTP